ncbi:hypothetical protein [Chloroflexus sp.]|uniref:hypothetical protein n=1 Tax=Chloroflexus sp. TaxID=1904827 RepID=UPI004048EEEA
MHPPTEDELDDMHCLVAAQTTCSTTAAARCHPAAGTNGPAHDASTRLLSRCHADGNAWWAEGPHGGAVTTGWLMIDDTTLDKPYRRVIALVRRHWSGTPHQVIVGLIRFRTQWTDGEAHLPCDVRIYDTAHDRVTTTEHA